MGDPQTSGGGNNSFPEVCAGIYYRYGLLVATHPIRVIIFAIATVLATCAPVQYLPLPGYLPQEHNTLVSNYSVPAPGAPPGLELGLSSPLIPLWYQGPPTAYIQQIVVRTTVTPWQEGVTVAESIRGPLFTAFHLSQIINDFQMKENPSVSLVSECLLVEEAVGNKKTGSSLPNYNCMMVSPADLWSRNPHAFVGDRNVLSTINAVKSANEGPLNVGDILFGVPSKDVGIKPKSNHPQIVTYAVTIVLKKYSEKFISSLERELTERLSLKQQSYPPRTYMTHVYFPSRLSMWELLMLGLYIFLFLSMYFSVVKMKGLYSKIGLAFSVLVTLLATLCIAVSISAQFGWRPLHSRWNFFYPVLSGLVGFENSMALIRSILSTADHLDIKIRVAQGLAKEGWMITKYFMAMITTLTVSFFLFIPFVQEICINGSLVLLCDLYMQLVFLTAVICIDLQRTQDDADPRRSAIVNPLFKYSAAPRLVNPKADLSVPNLHRRNRNVSACGEDRLAPPQSKPQMAESMPRRLRVTYYVAQKRLVQRMVIFGFIMWIAWVLFSADSFSERVNIRFNSLPSEIFSLTNKSFSINDATKVSRMSQPKDYHRNLTTESSKLLRQKHRYLFKRLSPAHWPYFFAYYNISLSGKYLTILPAITLSVPVSFEEARAASNPLDPLTEMWKPDLTTVTDSSSDDIDWDKESVIIPSTKGELMVTGVLLMPAFIFVMYAMVALYRCVCPRNYGEWRSSTSTDEEESETSQIIGETVPLVLSGHPHDVDCLSTDGSMIVSSCLAGNIYVWDPGTGECTGTIQRKFMPSTPPNGIIKESQPKFFLEPVSPNIAQHKEELPLSHSFPSLSSLPDLTPTIDLNFSDQNLKQRKSFSGDRFDHIEQLYEESKIYQHPGTPSAPFESVQNPISRRRQHSRNLSAGSISIDTKRKKSPSGSFVTRPIWCMECQDGLVFVGTGTGILEVWDVYTCKAKCLYEDQAGIGITLLKISGNTVVAARLNGSVDILELQAALVPVTMEPSDWTFDLSDPLALTRRALVRAHLQPITVLTCDDSRIITGSLDHTLKVLNISDGSRLFTLHGHYGPVTTVALGAATELECNSRTGIVVDLAGVNNVVASGAQDGSLCVWDIYTGTCVYSVQAHDGTVVSLACTSSYILSLGQDDKLCVWERFQGHLLNTLVMSHMYCTSLVMLTNRLLITGRQGSLNVWDITSGVPVRSVRLGNADSSTYIHNLLPVSGSIVCDYGNQLRVIRFPVAEKTD